MPVAEVILPRQIEGVFVNKQIALLTVAAIFSFATVSYAAVPAGAPTGSTGICNDGSYSAAANKKGACRGHKGVKSWYASDAVPAASAKPASTAVTTSKPMPASVTAAKIAAPAAPVKSAVVPAAMGGMGQVWVNTTSKVYHCPGDRYYGKTKAGAYMTEAAAIAAGDRADAGKACH